MIDTHPGAVASAMSRALLAVAVVVTVGIAVPAHAATANFDFEGQAIGTETPFALVSGGVTARFSGASSVDPGAFGISTNFPSPTGFQYRLMQGDFLTIGSAFGASGSALTIAFDAPIASFSLAFALDDTSNASALSFVTSAGGHAVASGSLTPGFVYPEGMLTYAGPAFSSITFTSTAIDFQMDNLQVTTAPVPEPNAAWLLAIGLPLIAFARRSRRIDAR